MFSNFQYQLQRERYNQIRESAAELLVIDIDDAKFTAQQIAALAQTKTVLSYLSIGQASSVRWYWDKNWVDAQGNPIDGKAPSWLGPKNQEWAGAYEVRYWEPAWRAILMKGIDRILAAGYAGVVYDVVDSFERWANVPTAPEDMKALVKALMDHGRAQNPQYIGIPNLGYQLLTDSSYLSAISAQLSESVFYLRGGPRPPSDTAWATDFLDRVTAAGKQVFVIEYVYPPKIRKQAAAKAKERGYVPYMTMKSLNTLEPVWQTYESA
jgi:cysteinyl-tRNA synthetase